MTRKLIGTPVRFRTVSIAAEEPHSPYALLILETKVPFGQPWISTSRSRGNDSMVTVSRPGVRADEHQRVRVPGLPGLHPGPLVVAEHERRRRLAGDHDVERLLRRPDVRRAWAEAAGDVLLDVEVRPARDAGREHERADHEPEEDPPEEAREAPPVGLGLAVPAHRGADRRRVHGVTVSVELGRAADASLQRGLHVKNGRRREGVPGGQDSAGSGRGVEARFGASQRSTCSSGMPLRAA